MNLRLKLFLPLILAGLMLLGYGYATWPQLTGSAEGNPLAALLLAGIAALLLAAAGNVERLVVRPLARLSQVVDTLVRGERGNPGTVSGNTGVEELETGVARLGELKRET